MNRTCLYLPLCQFGRPNILKLLLSRLIKRSRVSYCPFGANKAVEPRLDQEIVGRDQGSNFPTLIQLIEPEHHLGLANLISTAILHIQRLSLGHVCCM
jgi:hypothetical protein